MNKFVILLVVSLSFLVGCSSAGRSYVKSEMNETLEVEVLPNQSKMFTYRLRWPEDQIPNHIRVSRDGSDSRRDFYEGGVNVGRNTRERLLQNTAYVVEKAGYCREGFFELDRSISRYHLWVRGECKESASAADQQAFGVKQVLTPERWHQS
ncbi:putative lipoprotein [Cellvibrio sp. BR]|uniref:hypothetical protein n=1 Tax=Cellvibrio sp. BR TaxID=1134474 RepID=UPI00026018CF|nr:hypothetical protein [Cellvibrio sp. BR]EIK43421.1 putative lipoprotein [Cellvibrio sp. BR]